MPPWPFNDPLAAPCAMTVPDTRDSVRKAFVCRHCGGVYADQPVTQCDCMEGTGADFDEAFIVAALPQQAGGEDVLCHRLHTSDGRKAWRWVDGPPNEQAKDDARNFGWKMELAYSAEVIAALQAEVERLREYKRQAEMFQAFIIGEGAWERFQTLNGRAEAAEARAKEMEKDARRWGTFRRIVSISVEGMTPERWDAREDAYHEALEDGALAIDAAIGGTGDA